MLNSNHSNAAGLSSHSWRWRILFSMGASAFILFFLWWLVSSGNQSEDVALFKRVLRNTVWWLASIYIITAILQTLLRAVRYQSLLRADGIKAIPGTPYMFLITLARNMFVDMVPARIGEASYILMLNRGYHVPVSACLSTLFISIVLDMLALAVILIAIVLGAMFSATQFEISVGNALVATSLIVLISGLIIFAAVPLSRGFSRLMDFTQIRILQRFGEFLLEVGMSIRRVQQREILSLTLSQSLGIRVLKYGGLYILFIAVTLASFHEFASLPWWQILPAFITAEAAASLPLPTFMSFGTYEGGGMLAFSVLGFAAADILMVMFVIHLISQVVDYTLGGLGLMGFFLVTGKNKGKEEG
ncbi:MAG: flippase-like domain-containing protein [Gammaproteobacteria bacterium]|nr:flippase-like domain-containing protein [Gammaproteobacteria bacterium]